MVFQYKIDLIMYLYSHYKDKMFVRPSYLYDCNPYPGKGIYVYIYVQIFR